MLDFNRRNPNEWINEFIDAAIADNHAKETPRNYLGASILGHECERYLQFEYFNTVGETFAPRTLRIFKRGHMMEAYARDLLRQAGFNITDDQRGFSILNGAVKGHIDGEIFAAPDERIKTPCLWECKSVNEKTFKEYAKNGIKRSNTVYYVQNQIYQAYMELYRNPSLLTVLNCNTMEFYHELIPFNAAVAQAYSDRALMIVQACRNGELLKGLYGNESFYQCKWCRHKARCYQ